jgi:hypothetical protein
MQSRLSLEGSTQQSALSIQPKTTFTAKDGKGAKRSDYLTQITRDICDHSSQCVLLHLPFSFASFAVKSRLWLSATL